MFTIVFSGNASCIAVILTNLLVIPSKPDDFLMLRDSKICRIVASSTGIKEKLSQSGWFKRLKLLECGTSGSLLASSGQI